MAKAEKVTSTTLVWYRCYGIIGQRFENIAQITHGIEGAEQIGVPKCQTVRKKKSELEREVGPHNFKAEPGVEVNNDRTRQPGRRSASGIKADDRRPSYFLD
jgi:hypothetical protein